MYELDANGAATVAAISVPVVVAEVTVGEMVTEPPWISRDVRTAIPALSPAADVCPGPLVVRAASKAAVNSLWRRKIRSAVSVHGHPLPHKWYCAIAPMCNNGRHGRQGPKD